MPNKTHVTAIVALVAVVWAATLWMQGVSFTWKEVAPLTEPFSIAVSILYASIFLFDKWLWRIPWWRPWFIKRPVLAGTWKATLISNYVDQKTGETIPPIEAFWVVRQTFSSISIRLFAEKSASFSLVAEIVERQNGFLMLGTAYQSEPLARFRNSVSEIHYGAASVELVGQPPARLSGHYWTDRNTSGEMWLEQRRPKLISSYEEGVDLYLNDVPSWWRFWR